MGVPMTVLLAACEYSRGPVDRPSGDPGRHDRTSGLAGCTESLPGGGNTRAREGETRLICITSSLLTRDNPQPGGGFRQGREEYGDSKNSPHIPGLLSEVKKVDDHVS